MIYLNDEALESLAALMVDVPTVDGSPDGRSAMDGKPEVTKGKPDKLSGRKGEEALILALATGLSIPRAAKKAGVGVVTAYRRMEEPAFRQQVTRMRDSLLNEVVGKLVSVALKAVGALEKNLASRDEGERRQAAVAVLNSMMAGYTLTEVKRRLEALEDASDGRPERPVPQGAIPGAEAAPVPPWQNGRHG